MFPSQVFGVPVHPMLVHFPIGFYIGAVIFALIGLFSEKPVYRELVFWNLLLAVLFAIPTALSGLVQANTIVHNEQIHELMKRHKWINLSLTFAMIPLTYWSWRLKAEVSRKSNILFFGCLLAGAVALTYSGHLGGLMVYKEGAAVAPAEEVIKAERKAGGGHHHNADNPVTEKDHPDAPDQHHH